jgi:hypothetical protein
LAGIPNFAATQLVEFFDGGLGEVGQIPTGARRDCGRLSDKLAQGVHEFGEIQGQSIAKRDAGK